MPDSQSPLPALDLPSASTLSTEALDPRLLGAAASAAVRALLTEGASANTRASYRAAVRYWAAWYAMRYRTAFALPLSVATVLQFIVDHAQRATDQGLRHELPADIDVALVASGFKGRLGAPGLNTLVHRLTVLSALHVAHGAMNPCKEAPVRDLLAKTRRAYAKRGARSKKKDALTRETLEALLATCDDSLRGVRDRALLLFAWASGGRRRSEVTAASLENVRCLADGSYVYRLGAHKTNQAGVDNPEDEKPIVGRAAEALRIWLARAKIREGAIFRRIRRGDVVAESLSDSAVRNIVKARSAAAGVEGDFSAHSIRSGFLTEAGRRNVPLGDAMAMSGHVSVKTAMGYYRARQLGQSTAARLMDLDAASLDASPKDPEGSS